MFKVGFGRRDITPMLGIGIAGYYKTRIADGVLDALEANAVVFETGDDRVAMVSIDHCGFKQVLANKFKEYVSARTGLKEDSIIIAATHTHTGPYMRIDAEDLNEQEYVSFVMRRINDAVEEAIADLAPAKMGWHIGEAKNISFVRRFRMKDGSIKTNPGVDNPDILEPIGLVDERVNVLRFDRENKETVVFVNFGDHPDVVGGTKISADWPGFLRRTVEKSIDNVKCIFFNGAQGDVNHVNVHPRGGDLNGMFMDFDDVSRGYDHSRHMGRVVAGAVLQTYDKVKYVDVDSVNALTRKIDIPSNKPTADQLPLARKYVALHRADKDDEIPYKGMMLTTVVAEAERMLRLENAPDSFEVYLSGAKIGPIAFVGIPGEPFTGIGRALKEAGGYELIMPGCLTNGSEGYYPMQEAYDEGGYEARSSSFKAGVAELIIKEGIELIKEL